MPRRWSAGRPLVVEFVLPPGETIHYSVGTYAEGYGRKDLLAYGEAVIDSAADWMIPKYHQHPFAGEVVPELVFTLNLNVGRNWMACWEEDPVRVYSILPDIVVQT